MSYFISLTSCCHQGGERKSRKDPSRRFPKKRAATAVSQSSDVHYRLTPPAKILNRGTQVKPFVEELEFSQKVAIDGKKATEETTLGLKEADEERERNFTPLPFYGTLFYIVYSHTIFMLSMLIEAETQQLSREIFGSESEADEDNCSWIREQERGREEAPKESSRSVSEESTPAPTVDPVRRHIAMTNYGGSSTPAQVSTYSVPPKSSRAFDSHGACNAGSTDAVSSTDGASTSTVTTDSYYTELF